MKNINRIPALAAALALLASSAPLFAQAAAEPVNQTISQTQSGTGPFVGVNLQIAQLGNQANIQDNAFANASGNVGANVSAGNGNQQANVALVDAHSPAYVFSGDYEQSTSGEGTLFSGLEHASISGSAFAYSSGQVSANVAAGTWNQQGNAAMVAADDILNGTTVTMKQTDAFTGCGTCGLNSANVSGNAFDHSSGSIQANVAAGDLNHQLNQMMIEAGSTGDNTSMSQVSFAHLFVVNGLNTALITDSAFDHATGNIGVNVASGTGNMQMNSTDVEGWNAGGTVGIDQQNGLSLDVISGLNVANLAGNAFQNASGQIGVNTAAGYVNQQANALSVSH